MDKYKSRLESKTNEEVCSDYTAPQILTLEETAKILWVHRSTVSRFAKCGELVSYQLGSRRLFKLNDVLLFFENRIAPESRVDRRCVLQKESCDGDSRCAKTHP
jgi:excisionase family DNA binding protein